MLTVFVREFLAGLLSLLIGVAPAAPIATTPAPESSYVQQESSPARTMSVNSGNVSLSVDSPAGALPRSAKATLSKVSKPQLNKIRKEAAALLGTEIIDAVAFDISFVNKGIEIEPDGKVNITVNFPAIAESPCYTIIHFRDDGTTEIVPGSVTATSATFEADNFSVYAVIGSPEPIVPRITVIFMNGSDEIARMYVKDDDTANDLKTILYDPGAGTVPAGQVFKGWTTEQNYTKTSTLLTIAGVRTAVETAATGLTADDTITYYAAIFKQYKVTYVAEEGKEDEPKTEVTIGTEVAETPCRLTDAEYTINMGYSTDSVHNFIGWMPATNADLGKIVVPSDATLETVFKNGAKITINGDIKLTVSAPEGNWLVFNENGKGGKYIAPQFVKSGNNTEDPQHPASDSAIYPAAVVMTRHGYSFGGWYYFETGVELPEPDAKGMRNLDTATAFVFGQPLPKNTTLYAKWVPNTTATYTVILWTQNFNCTGYDISDSKVVENGSVGSSIPYTVRDNGDEDYVIVSGTTFHYTGFCLREDNKNLSVEITPEGDAVLNLHFDRIVYNLKFYLYRQAAGSNQSYNANGQRSYATRSNAGQNVWNIATGWTDVSASNVPTVGNAPGKTEPRFTVVRDETAQRENINSRSYYFGFYITLTAYYGEDIESKWPTYDEIIGPNNNGTKPVSFVMMNGTGLKGNNYNDSGYGDGRDTIKGVITVMDDGILGKTNDRNGNFLIVRYASYNDWTYNIYYETVPGVTYESTVEKTINGVTKTYYLDHTVASRSSNTYPAQQNPPAYQGFVVAKNADGSEYYDGFGPAGTQPGNITGRTVYLNYYFNRLAFQIHYLDGSYFAENTILETGGGAELHASSVYSYGDVITDADKEYKPTLPEGKSGYVFEGWYVDEACSQPYTFTSMPVGGITVFAKWRQVQYRVFLHPNAVEGGVYDQTLSWGKNEQGQEVNQAMNFRVSYDGTVSVPFGTRTGYEFLGWYTDEECTQIFSADTKLNDVTVTTAYDKTDLTDVMDRWGRIDPNSPTPEGETGPGYNSDLWDYSDHDSNPDDDITDFQFTYRERFWINKKFELYGKWSEIIVGAKGIQVTYDANGGTNPPSDVALYKDNTSANAGAAATAPEGKVFDYWILQKWNGTAFADTTTVIYPGGSFKVLKSNARITIKGTETVVLPSAVVDGQEYDYIIRLKAVYKDKEVETFTHIAWYSNYGTENDGKGTLYRYDKKDDQGNDSLKINEAVYIYGVTVTGEGTQATTTITVPEREGYKFLGWTKEQNGTEADFLVWDGTNYKTYGDDGVVVTQVAADEKEPIEDLFAVWEAPYYIYHTGVANGNRETKFVSDLKGQKLDLTKIVTSGTYYGGYYTDGQCTPPAAVDGVIPAYDGTNWTWNPPASYTEKGSAITPQTGVTYYIKEVPRYYMLPYAHMTYQGGIVKNLMVVTDFDDYTYALGGFTVNGTDVNMYGNDVFYTSLKVTTSVGGSSMILKPGELYTNELFPGYVAENYTVQGYIGYLWINSYLTSAQSAATDDEPAKITVGMWWKTPDGEIVRSDVTRTIVIENNTVDGIYYTDSDATATAVGGGNG